MKIKELIQAYARAKQNSKYRGATMQTDEMITEIASFGFGVYSTSNSIIIADPDDDANGFGIECSTLEEAYKEWDAAWALRDNS